MRDSLEDAVVHLVYGVSSLPDAVHEFSPEGYESISASFASYLEYMTPQIPKDRPVLIEVTGAQMGDAQQKAVKRAYAAYYQLKLSEHEGIMRTCFINTIWFIASFVLSSVLIFAANGVLNDVLVQYLYLPFWFFGYRVLTYPIFDYLPAWRESKRFKQMLGARLWFTPEPAQCLPQEFSAQSKPLAESGRDALSDQSPKSVVEHYFIEGDSVEMGCVVGGMEDMLNPASTPGHELLSDEVAAYLEQAEPFVKRDVSVELVVSGCSFSPGEKETIKTALRNHYSIQLDGVRHSLSDNGRKTIAFTLCLIFASAVLLLVGPAVDVAGHEFLVIVLWFFGDYLVEFILVDYLALRRLLRKYETISGMNVIFDE